MKGNKNEQYKRDAMYRTVLYCTVLYNVNSVTLFSPKKKMWVGFLIFVEALTHHRYSTVQYCTLKGLVLGETGYSSLSCCSGPLKWGTDLMVFNKLRDKTKKKKTVLLNIENGFPKGAL